MNTRLPGSDLLKHPTAWLPLGMSLAALVLFLTYLWVLAPVPQPDGDEGGPARVYQLLMSLQIPLALLFAVMWLPKQPRKTLLVLMLQACAWLAAFLPVLLLEM